MDNKLASMPLRKIQFIAYGLGEVAGQFVWTFLGTYLTIFYTDIVGLAPMVVSALMLIARLWDAINDPMMGAIAERTKSKYGRFRPWIAFVSPFLAVFGVLVFTSPFGNGTAGVVWASATYIIAGMLYTAVGIPFASLMSVMSMDTEEVNRLSSMRSVGMFVGQIIVSFMSSSLILALSKNAEPTKQGYFWTAVVFGIIAVILYQFLFAMSREAVRPIKNEKVSLGTTLKTVTTNKYLIKIVAIMFFLMVGYLGRISIVSYYVIYCIGSFSLIGPFMGIMSIGGIAGGLLAMSIMKKIGKKKTLMLGLILSSSALATMYFIPVDKLPLLFAAQFVYGLGGMATPAGQSMVVDAVDYQEEKTGVRTDGIAFAFYGFASKAGTAVGSAVVLAVLQAFGYVANQQQSAETIQGIQIAVNILPIICFVIAFGLSFLWRKSDREFDEIRVSLAKKREQQEEA